MYDFKFVKDPFDNIIFLFQSFTMISKSIIADDKHQELNISFTF